MCKQSFIISCYCYWLSRRTLSIFQIYTCFSSSIFIANVEKPSKIVQNQYWKNRSNQWNLFNHWKSLRGEPSRGQELWCCFMGWSNWTSRWHLVFYARMPYFWRGISIPPLTLRWDGIIYFEHRTWGDRTVWHPHRCLVSWGHRLQRYFVGFAPHLSLGQETVEG